MSKTWTIDADGVLTIRKGFRKRKGHPDFYARREEIKAIVVEEGVSSVGDGHLLSIDVAKGNKHFTSRHGVLYNHDMTAILQYPCAKRRKEYVIPASVEMIAEDCFSHARHLEHVVLPEQLKRIGGSAFGFCRRLKRAWVPDGVELIQITD